MVAAITRELLCAAQPHTGAAPVDHVVHSAPALVMPHGDTKEYPIMVASLGVAARHLRTKVRADRGHRTLVTGMTTTVDARQQGIELARLLVGPGVRTVVVEWNADGRSVAETLGASRHPGMAELLQGAASLQQVMQLLPGSTGLHFVAPGEASSSVAMRDADQVNLVFDAIDDAYDHVVFVGEYDALHVLFTVIEGRFDTVVELAASDHAQTARSAPGTLFGCAVSGIEVLRLGTASVAPRRHASLVRLSSEALA
jgi:hypothetical protein